MHLPSLNSASTKLRNNKSKTLPALLRVQPKDDIKMSDSIQRKPTDVMQTRPRVEKHVVCLTLPPE